MSYPNQAAILAAATDQGGVLLLGPPEQVGTEHGGTILYKQVVAEVHESTISKRFFMFYELANGTCYWMNAPYVKQLGNEPPPEV